MLERLGNHGKVELLADVSLYVAAAVLPLGIIAWLMGLWAADISVPFAYGGDASFVLAGVKGLFETGSYLTNPSLGAPGIAQFYDTPGSDGLNWLVLRVIGLFGMSSGTAVNLFYLAGYSAVGVATAFVLRRLHVSRLSSLGAAILFALLPYHYMRGEGHLFLSMYWIIPLLLLVLLWLDSSDPPLVKHGAGGWFPFALRNRRSIAALVICAAAGACGVYYMFFACFFLAVVGLRVTLRDRSYRVALAAAAFVLVSAFVFAPQMIPSAVYSARVTVGTRWPRYVVPTRLRSSASGSPRCCCPPTTTVCRSWRTGALDTVPPAHGATRRRTWRRSGSSARWASSCRSRRSS